MQEINKVLNIENFGIGTLIAMVWTTLGGNDSMLKLVLIAMAFDFITGVLKAVRSRTLSSRMCYEGIMKKVVMLMVIAFGVALDEMASISGERVNARTILLLFYLGNESISMLENVEALGVPIPEKLKEILNNYKKKGGSGE